MAELRRQLPPYCVPKKQKTHVLIYFQVPPHLRPAGWNPPDGAIARTDQHSWDEIMERGNAWYASLEATRKNVDLRMDPKRPPRGSLADVILIYKKSEYWLNLKEATRASYAPRLDVIRKWSEGSRFAHVRDYEPRHIAAFLSRWKDTPRTRQYFKAILSVLFNVAQAEGLTETNVVKSFKLPRSRKKKKKLMVWEEKDVLTFVAKADEIGYSNIGTAVLIGFETGQRQTDILAFQEPRDYHKGRFAFETSKTEKRLYLKATKRLQDRLARRAAGQALLTVRDDIGGPWLYTAFSRLFREVRDACGMTGFLFKQLRNSAAIHAERADLTDAEFEAIFGWPRANVRKMMRDFYGDRDQEVADRGLAKLENYRKAARKKRKKVGSNS